jgi:Fe-S cluster assembly iron-binding protein IscA
MTEQDGIQFLVNERDQVYFERTKIDYIKSLFGGGQFKVLQV